MDSLYFPQTERSPLLELDFAKRRMRIEGESYPENAAAFFGPVLKSLAHYLASPAQDGSSSQFLVDLRMAYFNSSSAKALMNIFQLLESAARRGVRIQINWYYHPDDETMMEFGEDFGEDFERARFSLCVLGEDGE